MSLNSTGAISLGGSTTGQSIAVELGQSATAAISLNDTAVRTLAGAATGAISMSDLRGKTKVVPGSQSYGAGTYSWIAPAGVTSVSIVAVGGGGAGGYGSGTYYSGGSGGSGGLSYSNNISVTPGTSYNIVVGIRGESRQYLAGTDGGASSAISAYAGGGGGGDSATDACGRSGFGNQTAGTGGYGSYQSGNPGTRGSNCNSAIPGGAGLTAYSGGGVYGEGGAGGSGSLWSANLFGGSGGSGYVRIVWPGDTRRFPSTNVGSP